MPEAFVFTAGDNAYFLGNAADYNNCYKPRWGRFLSRTYPSAGQSRIRQRHQRRSPTSTIFGGRPIGDRGIGSYSYTLGNWHIIALNSNVAVGAGSEQYAVAEQRSRREQHSVTAKCTLAYWHHPLFTSGPSAGSNGDDARRLGRALRVRRRRRRQRPRSSLRALLAAGPHRHSQAPAGITEYIVGTGGAPLYDFGPTAPNSAIKFRTYGVRLSHAAGRRLGFGLRRGRNRGAPRFLHGALPLIASRF